MPLVWVRVTILDPFEGAEGEAWRSEVIRHVVESLDTANAILGAREIHVQQSGAVRVLPPLRSQQLLTHDVRLRAGPNQADRQRTLAADHAAGEQRYRELRAEGVEAPHYRHAEYFVNAGLSYAPGAGLAYGEALEILRINRQSHCVAVYWVPGIADTTALAMYQPFYTNVSPQEEGIFMRPGTGPDTLAHELGHLLMRCGHCSDPDNPGHRPGCDCAGPDNLMHGSGDRRVVPTQRIRMRQFFTRQQADRLLREASHAGYLAA